MEDLTTKITTTAIIINHDKINVPNIIRQELDQFDLFLQDEDYESICIYVGTDDITEEFKIFLNNQDDKYYGYTHGDELLGGLAEAVLYYV